MPMKHILHYSFDYCIPLPWVTLPHCNKKKNLESSLQVNIIGGYYIHLSSFCLLFIFTVHLMFKLYSPCFLLYSSRYPFYSCFSFHFVKCTICTYLGFLITLCVQDYSKMLKRNKTNNSFLTHNENSKSARDRCARPKTFPGAYATVKNGGIEIACAFSNVSIFESPELSLFSPEFSKFYYLKQFTKVKTSM